MEESKLRSLAEAYEAKFRNSSAQDMLSVILTEHKGNIALATSLGLEDQVLTDLICKIEPATRIFTLDTGRLFPETYDLLDLTNKRYKINIEVYFPDFKQVEEMVRTKGINLFYESYDNRKLCCKVRKTEPLQRALKNTDFWISGLRREQSVTRVDLKKVEFDQINKKIKINPLINWTLEETWDYIRSNKVFYNHLHDKGYPSIGCYPCTRAVEPGEDVRAGRWWWEDEHMRECGLHR